MSTLEISLLQFTVRLSDIKVGGYKINIDGLFSVGFQLLRAKGEPNSPEVVDFWHRRKKGC